jgi:hypothetical protein
VGTDRVLITRPAIAVSMTTEPTTATAEKADGLPLFIKLLLLVAALVVAYVLFVDILGFVSLL